MKGHTMAAKTFTARIALAVDSAGEWYAIGYKHRHSDKAARLMMSDAVCGLENATDSIRHHWVEVEVPIPDEVAETLQGKLDEGAVPG